MATETITDIVTGITNRRVKEIAEEIYDEIVDVLREHESDHDDHVHAWQTVKIKWNTQSYGNFVSGAEGDIHGGFLNHVWIGSNAPSAYYLDQGNGGSGRMIMSRRMFDGRGRYPGKLKLQDGTYRSWVMGYDGIHYIQEIADRHR